MVAGTGSASFGPILKTIYPRSKYIEVVEQADPALGLMDKPDDFEGDYIKVPVQHLLTQSVGSTIAYAESNAQDSEFSAFLVTRKKYYASNQFERELAEAAKSDKGSFLRGMQKVIKDGAQILGGRELPRQIYGNTAGSRGVAATIAGADITLSDPRTAIWFKKGMILQLADPATPTTARAGTVTVSSVAMTSTTGTVTCTGNVVAGIGACANGDIVYRNGDINQCIDGFDGWNPVTAPTGGDSHYGIDRSVAVEELAGLRMTSAATNLEDALMDALAEFGWKGADSIDYGFLHTQRFMELAKEAGSRVTRDDSVKSKEAGFGYKALSIVGPNGLVKLLPSWAIAYSTVRFVTMDTWKLHTLGGSAPHVMKDPIDGKYIHRVAGTDRYKIEQGWYANAVCDCPIRNGVVTLT